MKFFLYECRHGDEKILVPATREGWDYLIEYQERCNGATVEEIVEEAETYGYNPDMDGSFEQGFFFIDDGGEIETIEVTDILKTP